MCVNIIYVCMYLSLLCYMFNIVLSESSDMYELRIYELSHGSK